MDNRTIQTTAAIINFLHQNAPSEFTTQEIINHLGTDLNGINCDHSDEDVQNLLRYMAAGKFIYRVGDEHYEAYCAVTK